LAITKGERRGKGWNKQIRKGYKRSDKQKRGQNRIIESRHGWIPQKVGGIDNRRDSQERKRTQGMGTVPIRYKESVRDTNSTTSGETSTE